MITRSLFALGALATGLATWPGPCGAKDLPAAPAAAAETGMTIQDGSTVQIDYTLTVDGSVVDTSEGRAPLTYVQGRGQIIPGLERQLAGLKAGDAGTFTVEPADGYGTVDPKAFIAIERSQLPQDMTPEVGMMIQGQGPDGTPFRARIDKVAADSVTLDLNHPLAGKTLQFKIKVVGVAPGR